MICINELLFMCLLSLQTHFVHMSYPKALARASRPRGVLEMQATTHSGQYDFLCLIDEKKLKVKHNFARHI